MVGAAGILAKQALAVESSWPLLLSFTALFGAAGVGMTRRSLVPQILSRGAAWIVLLPVLLVTGVAFADGRPPPLEIAGLGAATSAALLLARPMLHTREAREQFSPRVFRRWLLAGSTATAATACVTGAIALTSLTLHGPRWSSAALAALAASLFASAIAVVRMRSWGIFLGGLTSVILLMTGLFLGRAEAILLSLAAAPTLLMHLLPVLVARSSGHDDTSKVRVSDDLVTEPSATAHYRIAADDDHAGAPAIEAEAAKRAAVRA